MFSWSSYFEHSEVFQQPTSLSQVGPNHPAFGGQARGKISASVAHVESKQSTISSHVDTVDKTGCSKFKLKFPCMLCEGDHLTHKCPAIVEVRRVWSKTQEFPSPEQPIVSQQPTQPLVDLVVEPSQSLVHPTLRLESDSCVIEPISSLVNFTLPSKNAFHKAIESIPSSIDPTLPLHSKLYTSHIFFTSSLELN